MKLTTNDFNEIVNQYFENQRKVYECHSNRASQLGSPCERQLVYMRTHWHEAQLPEKKLIQIFEEGRDQEQIVIRKLLKLGFEVIEAQRPISSGIFKKHNITGHPEGRLVKDNEKILFEIKSAASSYYSTLKSINDYQKYTWGKKYYAQCQIYMLEYGDEIMWMIVKEKGTASFHVLDEIKLDLEYTENLLKKAERINDHVKNRTLPERYTEDIRECKNCSFNHICLPDLEGGLGIEFFDNKETLKKLVRWHELRESHLEYNRLDKILKDDFKSFKSNELSIGDFIVSKKEDRNKKVSILIEKLA